MNDSAQRPAPPRPGVLASLVGRVGVWVILGLIRVLGRSHRRADVAWLEGPIGGTTIGDAPYAAAAAREGLTVVRRSADGGLLPSFEVLRSDGFDPSRAHPLVRDFYEHTGAWAMDVWSRTWFPMNVGLALLVTTISRQVDQLNFPLSPLETAMGISSEIITLKRADGTVRYTGWFRTLREPERVLYTGFYMTERPPAERGPCVKVVFPMPGGNATVLLRPSLREDGSLVLDSSGARFGEAGFYRLQADGPDRLNMWHVRSLKEHFHVYVDRAGALRCDHDVKFLGLPVLRLHYKLARVAAAAAA